VGFMDFEWVGMHASSFFLLLHRSVSMRGFFAANAHVGPNEDRPNMQVAPLGASEDCMEAPEFSVWRC
jgi:hypothetical protein